VDVLIFELLSGPDLNPIGPCSVKMWGGRPHINFLTSMYKNSVDTCELYEILLLLSELRVETRLSAFESLMAYS